MYIDEKILKIIFRAKDQETLEQIIKDYTININKITESVFKKYFSDESIPKPRLKGFVDLIDLSDKVDSTDNSAKEKIFANALKTASSTAEFKIMIQKAIKVFNEKLLELQLQDLDDDEIKELLDYIEELKQNIEKAQHIYKKILQEKSFN